MIFDHIHPKLHRIGSGAWKPGVVEPWRRLYDHQLVWVDAGRCRIDIGSTGREYGAGEWVIIPCGVAHRSEALAGGVLRRWAHFDWDHGWPGVPPICVFLPEALPKTALHPAPVWVPEEILQGVLPSERREEIRGLFASMQLRFEHSMQLERYCAEVVLHELLLRLLVAPEAPAAESETENPALRQAKYLLDQRPGHACSIRRLLASTGQSYEHLCRCFKRNYGVSPGRYLQMLRIEYAKQLLVVPGLELKEIAERCGYADLPTFSRNFHQVAGVSPRQWRLAHL